MPLKIVAGGAGSGKSEYIFKQILSDIASDENACVVLAVPDQFSYTAEKTLSDALGGLGINRIEVVTFSRLCKRFIKSDDTLMPAGKMMLIQKVLSGISEENMFFRSKKHNGFIDSLSSLFSELRRYGITPEELDGISSENALTTEKIASVNEIYKSYLQDISEDFSDSDDVFYRFAEFIEMSDTFCDTYFYIDDYNDFMPQYYAVISALAGKCRRVTVSLSLSGEQDSELFSTVRKTMNRLSAISESHGESAEIVRLYGKCDYIKSEDIRFLVENWEEKSRYGKKSENISIFNALDIYSEAEHIAAKIISLVRDCDYRFKDIGIICGDTKQYLHILTSVFEDFDIPLFTDEKTSIAMHPIARTVLSLFEIIEENWSYASVFDYLRSGYIYTKTENGVVPISQEDVDIVENYVLFNGIKGKKAWFSEWTENGETLFDDVTENYSRETYDLEKLNRLRIMITEPFVSFLENKGRTPAALSEAVYNFMCDINLYDGLLLECARFEAEGRLNESEQFKQVWNMIMETLDQLVIVSKGGAISREAFSERFLCGLSRCEIAIIPPGLDRVSIGTVSRNTPTKVKALFIIGAAHGLIPASASGINILSDFDRSIVNSELKKKNKELAPDNIANLQLENFKLYRTLTTATEKLFISCPSVDADGSPVNFAHFVNEIIDMFGITVEDNIISEPSADELLASPKRGFYCLLHKMSEFYKNKPEKLWDSVYKWYSKNPEYSDKLDIIKAASEYKRLQPALSRIKAEMLYGKGKKYSATALEKYNICPFSYYLQSGLHLITKEEQRIEKSHIGSLVHAAICEFCRAVEGDSKTIPEIHRRWSELSDAECEEILHSVMNSISEKILSRVKNDRGKIEYLLSRCETTLKNSVSVIRQSLSKGEYTSICYEKNFEVNIGKKGEGITLFGTIDRIDVMEKPSEKKLNIRIIDYKSGNKVFSLSAICDKVDMQLVLYAIAASEMAKCGILTGKNDLEPQISAILYSKIGDGENEKIPAELATATEGQFGKMQKLDGLIILDREDDTNTDSPFSPDELLSMDSSASYENQSEFLNVKLTKDGAIYKNAPVQSHRDFEIMMRYITKAAIDTDKKIKSGNIDIKPYRGANSPCEYCRFSEVCLFDSNLDGYRTPTNAENFLEFMEKEVSEDE